MDDTDLCSGCFQLKLFQQWFFEERYGAFDRKSLRYEKAGFDDDDGTFDALDPRIAGSEKDNAVIFCKDGTGYSEFAHKSRNGNPDSLPFVWSFQNDSTIYFQDQYYKVKVLSRQRLELYSDQRCWRNKYEIYYCLETLKLFQDRYFPTIGTLRAYAKGFAADPDDRQN